MPVPLCQHRGRKGQPSSELTRPVCYGCRRQLACISRQQRKLREATSCHAAPSFLIGRMALTLALAPEATDGPTRQRPEGRR